MTQKTIFNILKDFAFNPLDPGSIYVFVGSVLASNITEKRVRRFSWNFHEMLEII